MVKSQSKNKWLDQDLEIVYLQNIIKVNEEISKSKERIQNFKDNQQLDNMIEYDINDYILDLCKIKGKEIFVKDITRKLDAIKLKQQVGQNIHYI